MKQYLIGIDNGGSTTKAAVFDLKGREIISAGRRIPLIEPCAGWVERDLNEVWKTNAELIKEVIHKAGIDPQEIAGLGLTGYGNGICLVDRDGNPVYNGIVSSDNRAADLCERLVENGVQDQVYHLTYQEFWPAQTAMLMVWLKENCPDILEKTDCILSIKDFIRMKLTGRRCYELTEMTCTGLMNIHTHEFDDVIFRALGLEDCRSKMPEYTGVTEISGTVTEEAAAQTGLAPGTPVAGSCYDVNACAMASGILDDDTLCMIAGTWSINEVLSKELVDGANSIAESYKPGYYIMEESSPTSAGNFEWFIEKLMEPERKGTDKSVFYGECNKMAEEIRPEESNVVFVPYLFASATNPDAKAAFFNLESYHGREHMVRAVYEGVAFSAMLHVNRLIESGRHFSRAKLSGGITRSEVWAQIFCDMLQMPLEVSEAMEPGALGAAMCAAVAGGAYRDVDEAVEHMVHMKKTYYPDPEKGAVYEKKFETYKRALKALDFFCGGEGTVC